MIFKQNNTYLSIIFKYNLILNNVSTHLLIIGMSLKQLITYLCLS